MNENDIEVHIMTRNRHTNYDYLVFLMQGLKKKE